MAEMSPKSFPANIADIHTHTGPLRPDAVLCVDPVEADRLPDGTGWLSVGVHPWNADKVDSAAWRRMEDWLEDRRVVAVGEAGLDRACSVPLDVQLPVFERQIAMAGERGLPLVIHCVRATDVVLALRKERPGGQWIYHGFRGKPATARQLLDAGIDLSFGKRYNQESYDITPGHRRFRETD